MEYGKAKKILIVSASIGTGHMQAARAIQEYWALKEPQAEVKHLDFIAKDTLSLERVIKEVYIKMIDIMPMAYDVIYRLTKSERQGDIVQTLVSWLLKGRMLKMIKREEPDVLIFTHPFPCGAASILKRQKLIDIPLVAVITDFAVHKFWVDPQVDLYCIGSRDLVKAMLDSHIPEDKIVVTGMPIRQAYFNRPQRDYTHIESFEALIMGGGLGLGAMQGVLRQLNLVSGIDKIHVVCGHNEALYETIYNMRKEIKADVKVYGYTTKIPKLMRRSAILFTKPGGLTCREALAMGLPMVFYSAIPGQEEENAALFETLNCARWMKDLTVVPRLMEEFMADPSILQRMSDASCGWSEDGAANIYQAITGLLTEELPEKLLVPSEVIL